MVKMAVDPIERVKKDRRLIVVDKPKAADTRIVLHGQIKPGLVDPVRRALEECTPTELVNLALAHYFDVPLDNLLAKE